MRERADLAILTGLVDGPVRERVDSAIPTGLVAGPVRERSSSALCRRVAVQLCVGEWQFSSVWESGSSASLVMAEASSFFSSVNICSGDGNLSFAARYGKGEPAFFCRSCTVCSVGHWHVLGL